MSIPLLILLLLISLRITGEVVRRSASHTDFHFGNCGG